MRMRLGILHDSAAQERMAERERKRAEEKKKQAETPTVMTELQQKKHDEEAAREKTEGGAKQDEKPYNPKIRPLSEAKAIDLGANFFSESFIFAVAVGLLVWDTVRSRNKAKDQREVLEDRLDIVEAEVERLRNKYEPDWKPLPEKVEEVNKFAWYNPAGWWMRTSSNESPAIEVVKEKEPPVAVGSQSITPKAADQAVKPAVEEKKALKDAEPQSESKTKPLNERVDVVSADNKQR